MAKRQTPTFKEIKHSLKIYVVRVTPAIAQGWLGLNLDNRPPSRAAIISYSSDMTNDAWLMTGDSIRFQGNFEKLLDGQNRLESCIASDTPFDTVVIAGLQAEAQHAMDRGVRRSFSHILTLQNVSYATTNAAVCRQIYLMKSMDLNRPRLSVATLLPVFEKHRRLLQDVSRSVYVKRTRGLQQSVAATMMLCMHKMKRADLAEQFHDVLASGRQAYKNCPVQLLREHMIRAKERHTVPSLEMVLHTTIKHTSVFIERGSIGRFEWERDAQALSGLNYRLL